MPIKMKVNRMFFIMMFVVGIGLLGLAGIWYPFETKAMVSTMFGFPLFLCGFVGTILNDKE